MPSTPETPALAMATLQLRVDVKDRSDLLSQVLQPLMDGELALRCPHAFAPGETLRLTVQGDVLHTPLNVGVVVTRSAPDAVVLRMPAERTEEWDLLRSLTDAALGRSVKTLRVLLVEDNPHIRHMYAHALYRSHDAAEARVMVEPVGDGQAALERLARQPPVNLVLTDLNMPILDGFELVRRLRSNPALAHLPVVVITVDDPAMDVRLQTMDVQAILQKPVQLTQVVATVRRLMASSVPHGGADA